MKVHMINLPQLYGALVTALFVVSSGPLESQAQDQSRTTLVVSQNPNDGGIKVVDQNSNKQLINTNQQVVDSNEEEDDETEEQVIRGLLEWLEEKKRKKKDKKKKRRPDNNKKPDLLPIIQPERHEPKEIHIHINNHIKKHHGHQKQRRRPQKKHHHGHYEDYHDGHDDHDYHDKHYSGKHSYPLLSHHYNWDYYGDHYSGHGHGDHYDDYSGHESKKSVSIARKSAESQIRKATQKGAEKLAKT